MSDDLTKLLDCATFDSTLADLLPENMADDRDRLRENFHFISGYVERQRSAASMQAIDDQLDSHAKEIGVTLGKRTPATGQADEVANLRRLVYDVFAPLYDARTIIELLRIGELDLANSARQRQLPTLSAQCEALLVRLHDAGATKPASQEPASLAPVGCFDCGRPYGHEHGFPDLIVPNHVWRQISPSRDDNGLLCPSCICKRLHDKGVKCEGAFLSGPIESVSYHTMYALRWCENLREQGHGWYCPHCGGSREQCHGHKTEATPKAAK